MQLPDLPAAPAEKPIAPPSDREMKAYLSILEFARVHGRMPDADEGLEFVKWTRRIRNRVPGTKRQATEEPSKYHERSRVGAAMRRIVRRVTTYLAAEAQIKSQMDVIGRAAMQTAHDCLVRKGPYDKSPRRLAAKAKAAADLLRICGVSREPAKSGLQIGIAFGQPIPAGELDRIRVERKALRNEQLAERLPAAAR